MSPRHLVTLSAALMLSFVASGLGANHNQSQTIPFNPEVRKFINTHCIQCHGPKKEKGDRVFHELGERQRDGWMIDLANDTDVQILRDILDQLNLGEMPPEDEDIKRPSDSQILKVTGWITKTLISVDDAKGAPQTVLRRLNRNEYRNTMRDLLGLDHLTIDPTSDFPADDAHEGFTNLGATLQLTDAHLKQYMEAAGRYLDMALHFENVPEAQTISISPEAWGYYNPRNVTPWMYRVPVPKSHLDIGAGRVPIAQKYDLATYPHHFARRGGIQTPGYYTIQITAEAIRRLTHPYDSNMIPTDLSSPMRLGLYVSDGMDGIAAGGVNARRRLAYWDLADHQEKTFKKTVWLAKGAIPFINWENGPGPSDYWMRDILKKYHTDVEFRGKQGVHAWHIKPPTAVPGRKISDVWKGPLMRVHDFSFTGPLPRTFASRAQQEFLNGESVADKIDIKEALRKFSRKAFRRPVSDKDIAPYLSIAEDAKTRLNRTPAQALRIALKAILTSPDFLYLKEIGNKDNKLTPHELANRLSYFIWSSMPDDELFALADSGKIMDAEVLKSQVTRMISDPKANGFVEGFSTSWLQLNKLGSMPPDEAKFFEFYRDDLEPLMREETRMFISHVLRQNRPITDFIDSRYTFLNQSLARHYGINDVKGSHFRAVAIANRKERGGLLGHASVLTLSANGVDTSPVIRGIWILEAMLGSPPPPPPPDVEPLDPDVRGAKTIRDRLEKHREVETCRDCHARIDPYGFPLEFYNPIGGYRSTYYWKKLSHYGDNLKGTRIPGPKIDGSAKLPSGEQFNDPSSLKHILLKRSEQFTHNLTEKLLTYACGRTMNYRDKQELDRITSEHIAGTHGFGDLVQQIVLSDTFQKR